VAEKEPLDAVTEKTEVPNAAVLLSVPETVPVLCEAAVSAARCTTPLPPARAFGKW
jgi:hypothetical protein